MDLITLYSSMYLSFAEIQTELANLPNFAAKIKNLLNISKFKF